MANLGAPSSVGTIKAVVASRHITLTIVQVALAFLNDSVQSTHGNVRVDSIFISPSGEWKLGGFEVLSNAKDDAAVLYVSQDTYNVAAGIAEYILLRPSADFSVIPICIPHRKSRAVAGQL